jgi:mannose-6-phosphate isomerase-like protein (cupin superfamily)
MLRLYYALDRVTPMKQSGSKISTISRERADHYVWGKVCDGWHLVRDTALSVIEESMPPGAKEVRHYHEKAQQFFYILSGEATMEANGETIRLHTGEGIRILPGVRHQIRNQSSEPVRFLVISQPPSHGDRVTE